MCTHTHRSIFKQLLGTHPLAHFLHNEPPLHLLTHSAPPPASSFRCSFLRRSLSVTPACTDHPLLKLSLYIWLSIYWQLESPAFWGIIRLYLDSSERIDSADSWVTGRARGKGGCESLMFMGSMASYSFGHQAFALFYYAVHVYKLFLLQWDFHRFLRIDIEISIFLTHFLSVKLMLGCGGCSPSICQHELA